MIPIVKIEGIKLHENGYERDNQYWSAISLIEHSKGYGVFDLPLAGINLNTEAWSQQSDIDWFIFHAKRVEEVDLKHPIILDDMGVICDGWHRVVKAILKGHKTIKAIRLESMPAPDKQLKTE